MGGLNADVEYAKTDINKYKKGYDNIEWGVLKKKTEAKSFHIFSDMTESLMTPSEADKYCKDRSVSIVYNYYSKNPKVQYRYKFSNGEGLTLNKIQAQLYCHAFNCKIESGGQMEYNKRDLYEGFNPGLGIDIRSKTHYRTEIKKRGLIEVGNETVKQIKTTKDEYVTDKALKAAIGNMKAELSGNEIKAIKNGVKLHKD